MPRPGPRPYECVRRAWHSDRHQPIRGSIIQQIFRVSNEAHSVATKKNKEWQEKLPIVVLKAEEIMYSKANSEAEYMDTETLWDRLNDAINTIIRRDESTESGAGALLPPCIEAALNLGCIPVRASRSQRHSNPRSYLSPRVQEPVSVPLRVLERTNDVQCSQSSQFQASSQLNFARINTTVSSMVPVSEYNRHLTEASKVASPCYYPSLNENIPPGCSTLLTKETNKELQLGSTYPLYYGKDYHIKRSHFVSHVPEVSCNNILVGKPISKSVVEATEMGALRNFFVCPSSEIAGKRFSQADLGNTQEKPPGTQYDLSLRLGPSADPCMRMERSSAQVTEDLASSSSQDRGKYAHLSQQRNMELFLSPSRNTNNPFDSFIFSTATDGKIKAWLYDNLGSRVDYDAPDHSSTTMAYSADGTRLFSCGTNKERESHLVEWNESEGTVKRKYGLGKRSAGVVQFDTTKNRILAAGDEFMVKFWDMDNINLLTSFDAEGGLPASPCIRFNKEGALLAVSTSDNSIKIVANSDGIRLLRTVENRTFDASGAASAAMVKFLPREATGPITHATYSCDSQSIYVSFEDGSVGILTTTLRMRCRINAAAYLPPNPSLRVYPLVIAAHPSDPNQIALGLTDGGVHVLEPLESDGKWGTSPPVENGAAACQSIASASASEQPQSQSQSQAQR